MREADKSFKLSSARLFADEKYINGVKQMRKMILGVAMAAGMAVMFGGCAQKAFEEKAQVRGKTPSMYTGLKMHRWTTAPMTCSSERTG